MSQTGVAFLDHMSYCQLLKSILLHGVLVMSLFDPDGTFVRVYDDFHYLPHQNRRKKLSQTFLPT
jgi:hypothetical protein